MWEDETHPKIEQTIFGPNGRTVLLAYKARRFTFPTIITVQPRRVITYIWLVAVFVLIALEDWRTA